MKENLKQRDYRKYSWKKQEWVIAVGKSVGVVILLSYFFYRSMLAVIPLCVIGIFFFQLNAERKKEQAKEALNQQFRECILSVTASLKAGYAVENAFLESRQDMKQLYGESSYIYQELEHIRRGLIINVTLEELLWDFAIRSESEEINQFVQVFAIAKRSGGNLSKIMETCANMIGQKIITKQEISILLSGRRLEQNVMRIMPFGILWYIGFSYSGYFDSLYHNWQGVLIMTGCLGLYLVGYMLSEKIMKELSL